MHRTNPLIVSNQILPSVLRNNYNLDYSLHFQLAHEPLYKASPVFLIFYFLHHEYLSSESSPIKPQTALCTLLSQALHSEKTNSPTPYTLYGKYCLETHLLYGSLHCFACIEDSLLTPHTNHESHLFFLHFQFQFLLPNQNIEPFQFEAC